MAETVPTLRDARTRSSRSSSSTATSRRTPLRAYRTDLEQLLAYPGRSSGASAEPGCRLPRSTPTACAASWAAARPRAISRASTARRLAALGRSRATSCARSAGRDPTALVGAPRKEHDAAGASDERRHGPPARGARPSTVAGRRDAAILELFYASGLRLSELVDLDLEDVNLSGRVVRVRGKGGKERLVPFNQAAAEAIARDDRRSRRHASVRRARAARPRRGTAGRAIRCS